MQAAEPPTEKLAETSGLRYVSDNEPGIRRRGAGRGFCYLNPDGRRLADAERLQQIRALAIPPAWTNVWICTDPCGHLQATGRDARGRKQYRYHPDWRASCERCKFDRVAAFGRALPGLRRRLRHDLDLPGLPRCKVLALVVCILADTLIRIGNPEYRRSNRSYGLTTLRDRHVRFLGGRAWLRFRGKSRQTVEASIHDPRLIRLVRRCQALPGQQLFQYVENNEGDPQPIDSGMVNDYLHQCMGEPFSAKDFRTWGGTLCAAVALASTPLPDPPSERALAAAELGVVRNVAGVLGNTAAVCRRAYIHPLLFDVWREGHLHRVAARHRLQSIPQCERFALCLLRSRRQAHRDEP